MKTIFLRVLEAADKATALLSAVREPDRARGWQRFAVDPDTFASVPGAPFAYWLSDRLRRSFRSMGQFESEGRYAKHGGTTLDDTRFLRLWTELSPLSLRDRAFMSFAKGGPERRFYADVSTCVRWADDGGEVKAHVGAVRARNGWGDQWTAVLNGYAFYLRPGLTWPLRAASFSPQVLPAGCVFSARGQCIFAPTEDLLAILAVCSSRAFDYLFKVRVGRSGHPEFLVGVLQELPFPSLDTESARELSMLVHRAWRLKRSLDTVNETSHVFALPVMVHARGGSLSECAASWVEHVRAVESELKVIEAAIDERCFALYGIDETDRRAIIDGFGAYATETPSHEDLRDAADDASEDGDERDSDNASLAAELVSWAVGVAFGRFEVRLATGARPLPPEPEPFEPLPACSPGMLTGDAGLPLTQPPGGYPLAFPEEGVLVDDPGHARNLTAAVRAVFDVVFGENADRWWHDVAARLDAKDNDLRVWLAGSFFEHHLKRHSKSRRKAPIVWQLGTPSGSYSVWLYAHRLTRDSFFQLQNEVVGPKLAHEERELTSLMQNAGGSPSAPERKEIAAQEAIVEELRAMLDEIKRVAPLWNPSLDDGVVLTMAPLWRLVPQCKPWQKELRTKWDELAAGRYDWAHLAMHLWPERVVPKGAIDRSLAIAHGLEDVFWVDGTDGKWQQRPVPTRSVDELVRERTSPAVISALRSLLDAPSPGGSSIRARKVKTNA